VGPDQTATEENEGAVAGMSWFNRHNEALRQGAQ
jgi:hypothetical protein